MFHNKKFRQKSDNVESHPIIVAVGYLQVSVDNIILVKITECRNDLGAVESAPALGEALTACLHLPARSRFYPCTLQ